MDQGQQIYSYVHRSRSQHKVDTHDCKLKWPIVVSLYCESEVYFFFTCIYIAVAFLIFEVA